MSENKVAATEENILVKGIPKDRLPQHVAIIMDGNNRWAKRNRLKSFAGGHRAGIKAVRKVIECCRDYEIKVLSVFAFSSENWQRPKDEINALMELFLTALRNEVKRLNKNQIKLKVIGDISAFSSDIQDNIKLAEELTAKNSRVTLLVAANYGGQWDITQATRKIAKKVSQGIIDPDKIDEGLIEENLSTAGIPCPDLLIRTSGEYRISNFMAWQCVYSELYFTDTLWPDFNETSFHQAMTVYASRERRFGKTAAR